jgi:hypothetical protein
MIQIVSFLDLLQGVGGGCVRHPGKNGTRIEMRLREKVDSENL